MGTRDEIADILDMIASLQYRFNRLSEKIVTTPGIVVKCEEMNIYYNITETPIFIVTKWSPDPHGYSAKIEKHTCIGPGEGIDISILGLSRNKNAKV